MNVPLKLLPIACLLGTGLLAFDPPKDPAPRFYATTVEGEKFSNDSVKGKVILLQFWTTWCPHCRSDEPVVNDLAKEFSEQGLVVLAVDVGESKKAVQKYLAENPRECKIVLTDKTNLAALYQANAFPVYVLIDRGGNVAGEQRGAGGERSLRGLLKKAGLDEKE